METQGYKNRRKKAQSFWAIVIDEYDNQNLTPTQIAKKHINPKTKKHYAREYIHEILRDKRQIIQKSE